MADLHSKILDVPPSGSKFFQFHAVFLENLAESYVDVPTLGKSFICHCGGSP